MIHPDIEMLTDETALRLCAASEHEKRGVLREALLAARAIGHAMGIAELAAARGKAAPPAEAGSSVLDDEAMRKALSEAAEAHAAAPGRAERPRAFEMECVTEPVAVTESGRKVGVFSYSRGIEAGLRAAREIIHGR